MIVFPIRGNTPLYSSKWERNRTESSPCGSYPLGRNEFRELVGVWINEAGQLVLDEPCLRPEEFSRKYSDDSMKRYIAPAPTAENLAASAKETQKNAGKNSKDGVKYKSRSSPDELFCSSCDKYVTNTFCEHCGGLTLNGIRWELPFSKSQIKELNAAMDVSLVSTVSEKMPSGNLVPTKVENGDQ